MQPFIGNLTKDATERTVGEHHVINFTVAENRYSTRDSQRVNNPVFVDCAIWNKPDLFNHFKKGVLVEVVGNVRQEVFIKDGEAFGKFVLPVIHFRFFNSPKSLPNQGVQQEAGNIPPEGIEQDSIDLPF